MVKLLLSYKAIPGIHNFSGKSAMKIVDEKIEELLVQINIKSDHLKQLTQQQAPEGFDFQKEELMQKMKQIHNSISQLKMT
jgi:hypothetical protein